MAPPQLMDDCLESSRRVVAASRDLLGDVAVSAQLIHRQVYRARKSISDSFELLHRSAAISANNETLKTLRGH